MIQCGQQFPVREVTSRTNNDEDMGLYLLL
jgi:hypothetical protein